MSTAEWTTLMETERERLRRFFGIDTDETDDLIL